MRILGVSFLFVLFSLSVSAQNPKYLDVYSVTSDTYTPAISDVNDRSVDRNLGNFLLDDQQKANPLERDNNF